MCGYTAVMHVPSNCQQCGYDLRGLAWDTCVGKQCPECGAHTPLGPPPRLWRVRNPIGFDGMLACGGIAAAAVSLVPTFWLRQTLSGPFVLAIWAIVILIEVCVIWSRRGRRETTTNWLVWHTCFALVAVPVVTAVAYQLMGVVVWMVLFR